VRFADSSIVRAICLIPSALVLPSRVPRGPIDSQRGQEAGDAGVVANFLVELLGIAEAAAGAEHGEAQTVRGQQTLELIEAVFVFQRQVGEGFTGAES
jgi:hypothetical protein